MLEPKDLAVARDQLAKAESMLMAEEGLCHLQEGLALLERVIANSPMAAQTGSVARNLGHTYANKVLGRITQELKEPRSVPEPNLEHFLALIRAFDDAGFDLSSGSSGLKVRLVRQLLDLYYEGYSPAEKKREFERLAAST